MDLRSKMDLINLRKPLLQVLYVLISICFVIQSCQWHASVDKVPSGTKGTAILFCGEMSSNMRISFVDTTDDYIYFAYSTIGVVAIYSKSGTYLCSYSFFSNTNGGLTIRCHEGKLYVNDHTNYEFVFEGTELVEIHQPSEAVYPYGWYIEKRILDIVIDNGQVFDLNGQYIMTVPGTFR